MFIALRETKGSELEAIGPFQTSEAAREVSERVLELRPPVDWQAIGDTVADEDAAILDALRRA